MKEYSRTYVSVDLGAVRHNIEEARKNIREMPMDMAPWRFRMP